MAVVGDVLPHCTSTSVGETYENQDVPNQELGDVDDKKLKMLLNGDDYK